MILSNTTYIYYWFLTLTVFSLNSFHFNESHVFCLSFFFSFGSTSKKPSAINGENITTFLIVLTAAGSSIFLLFFFLYALSVFGNIIVEILEVKREDQQPQYTYSILLLSVLITTKY